MQISKLEFSSDLVKFGIGLFETMKIHNSKIIFLDEHMDRLFKSNEILQINMQISQKELKTKLINIVKIKNYSKKALRLTLLKEGFNVSFRDIKYSQDDYENGFKMMIYPFFRGDNILYRHKTNNYFENIYAKNYAKNLAYDDAIFINYKNEILESTMANIFFIKNDELITPPSSLPILNGVIRQKIFEICKELDIKISQKSIPKTKIGDFNFAFLTNSLLDMIKISNIESCYFEKQNEIFEKINSKLKNSL